MRLFKKTIAMLLTIVLFTSLTGSVFAAEGDLWVVKKSSDGSVYLLNTQTGETMVQAIRLDKNGQPVNVDLYEYAKMLNDPLPPAMSTINGMQPQIWTTRYNLSTVIAYDYNETENYVGIGPPLKVTADVIGPAQISSGYDYSIGTSYGADVDLSSSIKNAIEAGVSFSWQSSLTSNESFGTNFNVAPGKKGYVQFRPYLNVSKGRLHEGILYGFIIISDKTYAAWGQCPIKLGNGFADGVYALVYK